MTESELALRQALCRVGHDMWLRGMVSANDGNISVRLDGDRILCTPTLVSKRRMDPLTLPVVDLMSGQVEKGSVLRPSSEFKMHLRCYQEGPQVNAVVHAHPMHATVFAIRGEGLVNKMLPESVVAMPEIPLAPYATPSTDAVAESIAPFVRTHTGCLLEHHGALTWGPDLETAYLAMERLEYTAQITALARQTGSTRELPDAEIARLQQIFGVSPRPVVE